MLIHKSDNLEILDFPDLEAHRFVLIKDYMDTWIVFLDRPRSFREDRVTGEEERVYSASKYKGRGTTPELAYMNLLDKTAHMLSVLYGYGKRSKVRSK
jgi:hypothetical protein